MKGSEIDDPGQPRRFPNWGARQQPIKICPLCSCYTIYRKIPNISYGLIEVRKHFSVGNMREAYIGKDLWDNK